ncbi:MAG: hypothetical protein WD269_03285 [Acidimicrobiia bacterium]
MNGRIQTRVAMLAALLAVTAVLIPAGLALGSHGGDPVLGGDPSVVLLTLGRPDEVTWDGDTQTISTRNNDCLVVDFADIPEILVVSAIGGQLGQVKDGLGVKSPGDGSGEPCGRVEADDDEAISVALGSHLDDYLMSAIDVDLELKFNAVVEISFSHGGIEVASDEFSPMAGSDDGPDSSDGDNFRYVFDPEDPVYFDEVEFRPTAGALSLEGGADGTENGTLETGNNSSQFEVTPVFDGQITCGDQVAIEDEVVDEVVGLVTMHALNLGDGWDAACIDLKNYNEEITSSSLLFAPTLANSQARYTLELTVEDQPITTDGEGQVTSLLMEYNDGAFGSSDTPLMPCLGQPTFSAAFFEQVDTGLLPDGEFACYYDVSVTPIGEVGGDVFGTEVWSIYFEDDPKFSFG